MHLLPSCRESIAVAVIVLTVLFAASAQAQRWEEAGMDADWGGNDYACTRTQVPVAENCTATSRGTVAVCWLKRQTGECQNAVSWCTYKTVKLGEKPTGTNPGKVFVCR
jgi:hypothetical protein